MYNIKSRGFSKFFPMWKLISFKCTKIGNNTIYKFKFFYGIFTILLKVKLYHSKNCNKSDSIWSLGVTFNSVTKYGSKILKLNFLIGALKINA